MYDAASLSDAPVLQRAVGELRVSLRVRDGQTVLDGLRQEGCLKARFPRPVVPDWLDMVTLNTSGGIAGGDVLVSSFQMQQGAQATIASQAAERFYRSRHGGVAASVRTRIEVTAGAAAEWLPQETILFDGCALGRRLDVDLADDAWFIGVESLVFGRAAMGEVVHGASLRDAIRIRRGGRLVLHDAIRIENEVHELLQQRAIASGAAAIATIWHVAPDAASRLDAVRAMLPAEAGASAWDGMLIVRALATDGASLRRTVVSALRTLRGDRPLPRVWQC